MTAPTQADKLIAGIARRFRLGQDTTLEIKHLIAPENKGLSEFSTDPHSLLFGQGVCNVS